jgi:hypothetical protein
MHDPEKWIPVFGKRPCSNKKIERDNDLKKSHLALAKLASHFDAKPDAACAFQRGDRMKQPTDDSRPIHHSPIFWLGILLCLAAIAIYLWSDDLSWRPAPRAR